MKLIAAAALALLAGSTHAQPGVSITRAHRHVAAQHAPVVQLAICLDTSGSMDGLIHQARTRIWAIVNDLASARHHGVAPRLEISLYQYGSDHHPAAENFTACILPFTSDLDAVSEALFALTIAGSNEYCGAAIQSAAEQLEWTATGEGALRLLVIAGNEPFTQGPVPYRSAVPNAVERGIIINTIYCGRDEEGQASGWLHAAHLAGGDYAVIDQDKVLIDIPCPQDEPLRLLNSRLNRTYLHYGRRGGESAKRQVMQDTANEAAAGSALFSRIASKSTANYANTGWDLVDLYNDKGASALAGIDRDTLPADARELSDTELEARVQQLDEQRASIQSEIQTLAAERDRHLAAERARLGESAEGTLDDALVASIRRHAENAGFSYTD